MLNHITALRAWLRRSASRRLFFIVASVLTALILFWFLSGLVRAYWIERTVHIFPTDVSSQGWANAEQALREDLSPNAPFEDFNIDSAASLTLDAEEGVEEKVEEVPTPVIDEAPVFPPLTPNPEPPPRDYFDPELPLPLLVPFLGEEGQEILDAIASSSEATLPEETATSTEPAAPVEPEEPGNASDVVVPAEILPPEAATSTSTTETATSSATTSEAFVPQAHSLFNRAQAFLGIETVFATTTDIASTSATTTGASSVPTTPTNSVAQCATLNTPCYTMRFSGFGVTGDLREKVLKGAQVGFSFASRLPENTENTLVVRYLSGGQWREAGEIYLTGDITNASNGGYFTATLPDVASWNDLSELEVEIEFVRGNTTIPAELFLDGLWLDTTYRERAQDVLRGEARDPEVPDNVSFTLAEARERALTLPDGSQITFGFSDDLDDVLFMRADRASYASRSGGETVVHASITNTGETEDEFALSVALPEGQVRIEQFLRNIASTTESVIEEDVTYFCETGWDRVRGDRYTCEATGLEYVCAWLNSTRENCLVESQEVGVQADVTYRSGWVALETNAERRAPRGVAPAGYAVVADTRGDILILPGQTLFFRITIDRPGARPVLFADGSTRGDLDTTALGSERRLRAQAERLARAEAALNEHLSKTEFEADELPTFDFKFNTQRSAPTRLFDRVLGREVAFTVTAAKLVHEGGERMDIPMRAIVGEDGEWRLDFTALPREFKAGRYTLDIQIEEGSEQFMDTIEFFWGVLAINVDESSYVQGEEVSLMMAVLDEIGNTICDADLALAVKTPGGVVHDVPISYSPDCGFNNVVETADYSARFVPEEEGVHEIELFYYDEDGALAHRLEDSFSVVRSAPFVIKRSGAMRIYPVANYAMELEVTATEDFQGEFVESVPESFMIESDAEVRLFGSAKNLVWPLSLKAGETARFRYVYDAPDISPYLYRLGPAEVRAESGAPFSEGRSWKLASDAVGNMLLYWDNTYIPTGWTCVSCLPGDPFYQRFIMGSTTAGTNGGATTHTHTATGVVDATGATGVSSTGGGGVDSAQNTHTHTYTPTIGTGNNVPPYRQLAVIQYNSTGEPPSIPTGAIAVFDAAVPSGWTRYAAQDGVFIRAEATSTIGTTGGSATHTHTITGNTLGSNTNTNAPGNSGVLTATNAHTHSVSSSTPSVTLEPPYLEVILGKLGATTTPPLDMIALWSGDAPTGWSTTSSSGGDFENRFLKGASAYGGMGGAATSTHNSVTGIISGAPSASSSRTVGGTSDASHTHTHSVSVTGFSIESSLPPYRTAVIAKRTGTAPAAPTLHNIPFESEKTGSSTPAFEFTASDPAGSESIIYQVEWDDDADLDVAPLGSASSTNESGCSPNCFQNLVTPADTSPFNEGERVRYRIQTPLVSGTTYYWRVRAKAEISSSFGDWSTTTSFTYVANTDPSQWFQTEDEQFDMNTLSNVETYGANSVRLVSAAETEVLVAYGEGTVQTPRYRIWDGAAWGSELSAQSVGGTIQWVVTAAGTQRNEYILGTQDASSDVNMQVYDGGGATWGDLQEVTTTIADVTARGFDVTYESLSGDGIVVYCDGDADPSYYVWDGTIWTSGGTINLSSANNCEWIQLASDPVSDEIILVARDTGAQYEAQVWNGSSWGSAQILGSMSDTLHEGIAVEYEESGNQAVVAVSNGLNNNFAWVSWDGAEWSVPTTQGLGDDFEWGILKKDVGTDSLALCYVDQDDDIGIVRWDGIGFSTFQEIETASNVGSGGLADGRSVTCEFETTAGRDGNIMVPYSDTAAARYRVWDGSTFNAENSVSTIQDSWWVESVRAGDGSILTVFFDDVNTQYDSSYWNGSSWSTASSIETTVSVTAEPFGAPFNMAAKVFREGSGTMTSAPVDFSLVPNQPTWGEVLWNTTEPNGTNVLLQILDGSTGSCGAALSDGVLPGNSAGFDVSASPVDLSAISTTTYDGLCLRAVLSSTNENSPTLDDWSLSWERQAVLTQTHFRWYANATGSLTPSDPWPSGGEDAAEDVGLTAHPPSFGAALRLRLGIRADNVSLSAGAVSLKLQYAAGSSCSADLSWSDVGAIGSTTALWRGFNNGSLSDGATIPSTVLTGSDVAGSYEEENASANNPNSATPGQEIEWDWVVQHNASSSQDYCFRAVKASGEVLNDYELYPAATTNAEPGTPTLEAPFDNEQTASSTPWFQFVAEDPEGNDITYQIQIDDDTTFASPTFDQNSQTNITDFTNIVTPSDKDPFTSAQSVRYVPASSLSSGTHYWRVRARDRNNSTEWSVWSSTYSFTIDPATTISTWFQTTQEQFDTDTLEDTEATTTDDVILLTGFTSGTTTSSAIDFDWKTTGNAWGELSWNDNETVGDIKYRVEYLNGASWEQVSDSDLPGNAAGFDASPISLLSLSPTTHNQIRLVGTFTDSGGTPRLLDWTVEWGFAVEQPSPSALFDNEKTGTTTPSFTFTSSDPQSDDLVYQISFSQTPDFTASTTRSSDLHAGFVNTASSTDTSPFTHAETISFTVQPGDAFTNGQTYWWRARAIDPSGGNVWSVWSPLRSFTIDTTIDVSTWFQTTDEQFDTDTLNDTETTGSDSVQITSLIREAFVAYSEGTVQAPRYRIWNGVSWSDEASGISVGDTIRFVEAAAAPTRDEYMVATLGSSGVVDAQVYNGLTDVFSTTTEIVAAVTDATQRGMDVAYETSSGDSLIVACSGTEATYKTWNGTNWSASTPITLSVSTNCEWVKLVSDPTSDEIVMVVRDATTGATDYEALVWNGSSWGNSTTTGAMAEVANEGIAVEYEESGGQAVFVVSNGANANFVWNSWNGSNWTGANTFTLQDDFENGRLVRDLGSDAMALCYVDEDADHGLVTWDGSGWTNAGEYELVSNSKAGRPLSCEFETLGARDGRIMIPYSDTISAQWQDWNGSVYSGETALTTITDANEVRSVRTGDGNILVVAYDDANTEYDFTYWNGSAWSDEQVLETTSITTVTPATIPLDMVARRYPAFTSGQVVSTPIDFDDGLGLKWDVLSWNESTLSGSDILMQVEYLNNGVWTLVPDGVLPGNSVGTSTSPLNLSSVVYTTYNTLRLAANFVCNAGTCPILQDWSLLWSPGLEVAGTAKQYDQTTDVTSGTVAVAVNGVLQAGKTGTISGGVWAIDNVTVFPGDTVTVFVQDAADANEAVAVTSYDGIGDIGGIELIERHLSIGSNDNPTITNTQIGAYDNSVSGDEDLFIEVDAGNDLNTCVLAECFDAELIVRSGSTFRPDSTSSGNVTTRFMEINGTIAGDGNSFFVSGNWDNNSAFTPNTSTVVFTATTSTAMIDSTSASSSAFYNVTFGQGSGSATWTLGSPLDVNGTLSIQYGTTSPGTQPITIAGNLTIGANGVFAKGSATTTFDGTGTSAWTDSTSAKQDMGRVVVDGTTKTVTLGAAAKVTDLTIGADDAFSLDNNYALEVQGNWTNNNSFLAQNGTVTFTSTTTGKTITPGNSNFYNLTFNGVGGNWAFVGSTVTATNDLSIYNGIPTFPTATTTIGGSLNATSSTFMHNNGVVVFTASSAKTVRPGSSSFYDLVFNGSGSWSFTDGFATSSRHTTITAGTVTMPSGVFAIGGSFAKDGGSFAHNNGILRFTSSSAQTVRLNSSDAYTLTFAGSGSWSFVDTSATLVNTLNFDSGAVTLPSGTLSLGGSLSATSGTFNANAGTIRFTATTTGKTINPGTSSFANMTFDSASGGWTISANATTTSAFTLTNLASFTQTSGTTLSVGGTFTNSVGGAGTTWTGSTLALVSGTSYSLNAKANTGDTYGTLAIGTNTDVRMWNSSADATTVNSTGSLYSQDHANVDGDLYIWGEYLGSDEYWTYANDFDGTALGGSSRQVDVRINAGANVNITGTLRMLGSASASTSIANQGSGVFALGVQGTVNAQYYSVRNTDANGLGLYATTTITSLAQGDFELGLTGGTMLSLSQGTVNQNPTLQIQQVRFATSTGVSSGFNVTATGTPISYVWFRNHYGNYASEQYDSDDGGNPGFVRFDDSGFSITVSGNVYSDHGTTPIGAPCDGSTPVVQIAVGGATSTGSCNAGTGAYSISGVEFTGDVVLTAFLDTNGGKRAVTAVKTPTGDITGLDLYERALVLRHEDVAPITIADLALYDSDNDADVFFSAATGSPHTLIVQPENELFVWGGKTFAPGGNVTLQSGGSGDVRDGRLELPASAVFTAAGTESHSVGGGFVTGSGSTFTPASSTFTFTATTTGKSINAASAIAFNNLIFNGGGGWSFDGAQVTANNTFQISSGTLSGTGSVVASAGVTGNGTIAMTGGTFTLGAGSFGGSSAWTFNNLAITSGTGTSTKTGAGTTTVSQVLSIGSGRQLEAGSSPWVLAGSGTPFAITGTFSVQSAPFYYTGTTTTTVADTTYAALTLEPALSGTPSYAIMGGTLSASSLTIGDANPVSLTADANDPSLSISGNVSIGTGSTFIASNTGVLQVGGSWANAGTFTHSGGTITFNSGDAGETIAPGGSSFGTLVFNSAAGGWTITGNATTTSAFTLTNLASFTQTSGTTLSVGGTFTNSVGGAGTTWTGSTLALVSGTSYSLNAKANTGDTYGTLAIGTNTDVRMWNSSADSTTVNATGSLYSQDHANVDGDLYIWGEYTRSTGSDYWSYATDFDGTALGGASRQVDVRVASSSSLSFSGGVLDIIGTTTASTTVAVQGSGAYSFALSGGTLSATHYEFRHLNATGLSLSGSPTISALADGYLELGVNGGSLITVAGSVIDANPLKTFMRVGFATSSGISSGTNVRATGSSVSSWKFNLHYGELYGEAYDDDPTGDPGYLRWDDSASDISISGNVYSDEGTTVSTVCDGSTPVVRLLIEGGSPQTASCVAGTGAFNFSSIFFNPGDTLTLYLNTDGGRKAVNVSSDPVTNITDMHLYENRVIVRHEDTTPLTIASMAVYDSDNDADIIFNATDAATDTLVLPPETKLIVWDSKTFAPAGNITLESGGSGNAWDGSLEVRSGASLLFAGAQAHAIGGNFELNSSASFTAANSTVTFTATTTGKTINPQSSSFYAITFNGSGGNWAFSTSTVTAASDFTITNGTVTLPTATTTIGGSFANTGGTFMHNNGVVVLNATTTGKTIRANGSNFATLIASSAAGSWTFLDTNATTTSLTVSAGALTLPSGTLAVGASFDAQGGTFTNSAGTIRFTSAVNDRTIRAGASAFYNLRFDGSGSWSFLDTNVSLNDMIWVQGSTTLPVGTTTMTGSFNASAGTFNANAGTIRFTATTTGKTINPGTSSFANMTFDSASGGWTISANATTTSAFTLTNLASFTQTSGTTLSVGGTFTNSVGGAGTTWTGSTLALVSGTSYSLNAKANTGDTYGTLAIGTNTDVRMWNSSADTTTVNSTGSLYSQDHANVDGDLYIWGEYTRSTGSDYWSYATDFDGTALGGSGRQVDVRVASSSTIAFSGGGLEIVGQAGATSTVRVQGTGRYAFSLAGGTLNASYYEFRNVDANGVTLSGTPSVTSLSNGDFELDLEGATMMTLGATAIDANASLQVSNVRFATSTGISSGFNVTATGTPVSSWTFIDHYGDRAGESYDSDGVDACGAIRWADSACLFVSQEHFRFRNDDGGEGVPTSEWFNAAWSKRKRLAFTNMDATAYTNVAVKVEVPYDADMQSDFDDLRFTDSSGTTTVPYWIEEVNASATSTVWVRVPSLSATGFTVLYMYYGNGSASDASDGDATFGFFDDFEDDNISEYTGETSLFDVDTAFNYEGTYGLDAGTNVDSRTTGGGLRRTGSLMAQGETIRFFQYVDASAEDEPCAFFAAGGSGSNYALCLDRYPDERVIIAENVTSNDGSGTVLASTTVAFSTGWYEVEVDWLSGGTINAYVYDDAGSLFATATTSDSSHTSGGMGFGFWGMHGGWDLYTTRAYTATEPTYLFGLEQSSNGATWKAAEDATLTGQVTDENIRLRFSVLNTGAPLSGQLFELQIAPKGASLNCESVPDVNYSSVPVAGSCGSAAACMTASANFVDQDLTAGLLSYPGNRSFAAGRMIEDASNQSASTSVPTNAATEIEYSFELTSNATQNAYCLRTTNDGTELDNYAQVAEVVLLHAPQITGFTLNGAFDIALTEGATTTVSATGTVSDLNGYADIVSSTSTIYRSGVGPQCSADFNSCYPTGQTVCSLSNCSGNSCTLTCSAEIYYFADATDVGSSYAGENWLSRVQVTDASGASDVETPIGVEMLTLYGLSLDTSGIDFGSLEVGQNTGTTNATTTLRNTGNANIDIQLSGTNLTDGSNTIAVGEQKFATTTFAYSACAICQFLTGSAANLELDLPKPTSTSTPITDELYWGINVPSGTAATLHQGTNTFIATSD